MENHKIMNENQMSWAQRAILLLVFLVSQTGAVAQIRLKELTLTKAGRVLHYEDKIETAIKLWGLPSKRYKWFDEDMGLTADVLKYGKDEVYFYKRRLGGFTVSSPNIKVADKRLVVGMPVPKGMPEVEKGFFSEEIEDANGNPCALILDIRTNSAKKITQIAVYPTN